MGLWRCLILTSSAVAFVSSAGCGTPSPPSSASSTTTGGLTEGSESTAAASASTGFDGGLTSGLDGRDSSSGEPPPSCGCAPSTDLVYVISDDGVLSSYDPQTHAFAEVGPIPCGDFAPYSMAVDREGNAWVLLLDNIPHATVAKGLFAVDVQAAAGCDPIPYAEGLFGVFGTSFVTNSAMDSCERFYVHSYSGQGPFSEGPDTGHLGVLEEGVLESLGTIDFDGGELAGTGDGRLFALAGAEPTRIIEYDKLTAQPRQTYALTGLPRTNASAMAFWGGDFYLFVEAGNPECIPCLERSCSEPLAACEADPDCAPVLECLLTNGGEGPGCSGDIEGPGGPLRDCLFESCLEPCAPSGVVSQVVHVDWDASDGAERSWSTVVEQAPMRVVGAGSSTCVPTAVP